MPEAPKSKGGACLVVAHAGGDEEDSSREAARAERVEKCKTVLLLSQLVIEKNNVDIKRMGCGERLACGVEFGDHLKVRLRTQ